MHNISQLSQQNLVPDLMVSPLHFSYPYPALDLDFLNQKLTIVNSTRAAKTNAVQSPSHASMACNELHLFRDNNFDNKRDIL